MKEQNDSSPRYVGIASTLREEVIQGHYDPKGRMPSEAQLVKRFGVSRPTIARALRELCDEDLIERRAGSGSYVKEGSRGETKSKSNWLALMIPNLENTEIFQEIGGEIANLAKTRDYGLVWGVSENPLTHPDKRRLEEQCRQFIDRNVAGVFFAPYEHIENAEEVNRAVAVMLREAGIPVILLDRDFTPFPKRSEFDLVTTDNFSSGFSLAEHLLKLGCKRIHFVARPLSATTVDARIAGVREAFVRYGIEPEKGWIRIGHLEDRKFMRSLFIPFLPDAFVCANDHTAATIIRECQSHKVRVPEQLKVVGFDDVKFASLVSPPLTTIHQPCREIARTAFHAMMERLRDATFPPCKQVLASRLVIRDSCGAYLPRSS